jgi:hypothetical protein
MNIFIISKCSLCIIRGIELCERLTICSYKAFDIIHAVFLFKKNLKTASCLRLQVKFDSIGPIETAVPVSGL